MKLAAYILVVIISLSSCDIQVGLEVSNARFTSSNYEGIADCHQYISLNETNMTVTIDRPFDDEDVVVNLGDGLSFEGTIAENGVITLDNRTRVRQSNGQSFRLTNGQLEPGFINDYDFTFYVSENNSQRGRCSVELDLN